MWHFLLHILLEKSQNEGVCKKKAVSKGCCCCCCISVFGILLLPISPMSFTSHLCLTHVLKLMLLPVHNPQSGFPMQSHRLCTLTGDHPTRGDQPKDSLITQCSTFFFFFLLEKPPLTHSAQCKNMHPLCSSQPIIYIMRLSIFPPR